MKIKNNIIHLEIKKILNKIKVGFSKQKNYLLRSREKKHYSKEVEK